MKSPQIDSSRFETKVMMRIDSLPKGNGIVRVLDLCSGQGEIWKDIKRRTGRDIKVTSIDQKKIPGIIKGDNRKIIPTAKLKYAVIDVDVYGSPYQQLIMLFENPTLEIGTVIHYTHIAVSFGSFNKGLLTWVGIPDTMAKKIPSMFSKFAHAALLEFLRKNGVKKVHEVDISQGGGRKGQRKGWYGYFVVAKQPKPVYTLNGSTNRKET